jgi:hypothetical protein
MKDFYCQSGSASERWQGIRSSIYCLSAQFASLECQHKQGVVTWWLSTLITPARRADLRPICASFFWKIRGALAGSVSGVGSTQCTGTAVCACRKCLLPVCASVWRVYSPTLRRRLAEKQWSRCRDSKETGERSQDNRGGFIESKLGDFRLHVWCVWPTI